jgi:hypothetical protein
MTLEEILKAAPDRSSMSVLTEAWGNNGWVKYQEDGVEVDKRVSIKEALATTDAPFLFPKVISRAIEEAIEPVQLIVPLLAEIRIDSRSIEVPALGAMQAHDIGEGMPYPEEELPYATRVEGKVIKRGLRVAFTDEIIADSMWDLMGLYLRAAGRALARKKEQVAQDRFWDRASTVKTNDIYSTPAVYGMSGVDVDGNLNGTFDLDDLIDMVAELVADERTFTHMIMHPLAWTIFAKDPVIRNFGLYGDRGIYNGQLVAGASRDQAQLVQAVANNAWPWIPQMILSPFVTFGAATGASSGTTLTDIYTIDSNDLGAVLQREDVSTEDFRDPQKDINNVKIKERYDVMIYGTDNIKLADNVVVARNYGDR